MASQALWSAVCGLAGHALLQLRFSLPGESNRHDVTKRLLFKRVTRHASYPDLVGRRAWMTREPRRALMGTRQAMPWQSLRNSIVFAYSRDPKPCRTERPIQSSWNMRCCFWGWMALGSQPHGLSSCAVESRQLRVEITGSRIRSF